MPYNIILGQKLMITILEKEENFSTLTKQFKRNSPETIQLVYQRRILTLNS